MSEGAAHDGSRDVAIFQSLVRPNLLFGCDRELVLVFLLFCAALVFSVARWWAVAIGVFAWVVAVAMLRRMATVDPMLRHVYVRHLKYQRYYPAKSGIRAMAARVPPAWR